MEPFHRTLLDENFRGEGRRTWFATIGEMQPALDEYVVSCNRKRPHKGRAMNGPTPWHAFRHSLPNTAKWSKMTEQEDRKGPLINPRPDCRHSVGIVRCSPYQYRRSIMQIRLSTNQTDATIRGQ